MKIAYFSDNFYPELSGIADSILMTGTELARRGHEVHYFVPKYSQSQYKLGGLEKKEPELLPGMYVHRVLSVSFPTPTMQGRVFLPNFFRGLKGRRFDVIHTQSFLGPGLDALALARFTKTPLIGTNHTLVEEFIRYSPVRNRWAQEKILKYVIWYYNHCLRVSAPSNFLVNDMKSKGLVVPIEAISNPIDSEFFATSKDRMSLKKELGFNKFTVLNVGRISTEKGVETLFEGFVPFAREHSEAELIIVGQGVLRKTLESRAKESGIESQIKFMGPYLGEKKRTLYDIFHASDLFVTASTSETQCMTMLAAMAASIPSIGARAGALPEYITADRGLLFEAGDASGLTAHLQTMIAKPEMRSALGEGANTFARTVSISNIADVWEKIYAEI